MGREEVRRGRSLPAEGTPSPELEQRRMVSEVVPRGTQARREARAPSVPVGHLGQLPRNLLGRPQREAVPPTPPPPRVDTPRPASENELAQTIPASADNVAESTGPFPTQAPVPEGARSLSQLPSDHASAPPSTKGPLTPLDEALLATLEEAFLLHAGADGVLDAGELQRALGLRNPLLAERLLTVFDRDGDGVVTRAEFVERVRRLLYGNAREKLRFAFRIHDLDGDHRISRDETLTMIRASLEEEGFSEEEQNPESLTQLIFADADRNGDGFISYREFEAALESHPAVLEMITRCEACWIAPGRDLLRRGGLPASGFRRLRRFVANRAPTLVVFVGWALLNVVLGLRAALHYQAQGESEFVMVARACGACLNLNGALILIPVMRRLLTWVRRRPALSKLPVDEAVTFHRIVGQTMFVMALVHTVAHLLNYGASGIGISRGVWGTSAGLTGVILLAVFAIMWVCSLPFVRRTRRFELFYFTHLLYVAWFALCLLHGPVFYLWAGVPLLGFAMEQVLRRTKGSRESVAIQVTPLSSGVTQLLMQRPRGFEFQAGDYAFIKIPSLAKHEWHPFTISSAPQRREITMHVRSLGNFTRALRALAVKRTQDGVSQPMPVSIDGPYGTPSAHIFDSRNVVLVGAGIGVTPFASVLESIVLRAREGSPGPEKVHFFWLSRDAYSFEWFAELLMRLEEIDTKNLVDLHIYMTGGRGNMTATALNLARSIAHDLGKPDLITGLRSKTKLGKPDFDEELRKIREQHGGQTVDLFFCGPPGLGHVIQGACREQGIRFRQEHF